MKSLVLAISAASLLTFAGAIAADEWKDESGKTHELKQPYGHAEDGHWRGKDEHARKEALEIPPGHYPPPGECRDWYPELPAGHQPPPYRCQYE